MELFNKADVLTEITCNRAKIGDKGYFGDSLPKLIDNIKRNDVRTLTDIIETILYCFEVENNQYRAFFLPIDKVKCKEITYRPLRSIDELFDFMLPDYAGADYTTDEKVEKLLGQRYTIKNKIDGTLKQHIVSFLNTSADGTLLLDFIDLDSLFENYEFKKGDKFVPFGIEE